MAAEAPLPFAALHRLLRPLLRVDDLPSPQAKALSLAFGLIDDPRSTVEPFLVGLATLSVLTTAAEKVLLLCLVDDAQWADAASADALLFAARQLQVDHVAMVFAARDDLGTSFDPEGLDILRLDGLPAEAARLLVAERAGVEPSAEVVDRLVAGTRGNPLALLELPLGDDAIAGRAPLPARLGVSQRVERAFLDRVRAATPGVQALVLLAAADDTGKVGVLQSASTAVGVTDDDWLAAERSGLLAVQGDRVTVRHPLVRSAVYQAATSLERRRAHAAVADGLMGDPDRRTWHLALAADRPDESLAHALEDGGHRAELRGAHRSASESFARAADLSLSPADRARRLYLQARSDWAAGDAGQALDRAFEARTLTVDPVLRADVDRLRGRVAMNVGDAAEGHRIFVHAIRDVAPHDQDRALEMAVAAAVAQSHGIDSGVRVADDIVNVIDVPNEPDRTRTLKRLLVSTRHDIDGDRARALTELHAAMAVAASSGQCLADLDLLGNLANAALHLGDDRSQGRFYSLMLAGARERGDGMRVLYALQRLAFGLYVAGSWTELRGVAEEAVTLSMSVGQPSSSAAPRAWLALLSAQRGGPNTTARVAEVRALVAQRPPAGILAQPVLDLINWASGISALLSGAPAQAALEFEAMRLPALRAMAAADRVDASVAAADLRRAEDWSREFEAYVGDLDLAWARGSLAFARARAAELSGDDSALVQALFEQSLEAHADAGRPYDRARVQLAYGEFLRRQQRRADARDHLRAAGATFASLSAAPWEERAMGELRASGETARKRDPSTLLNLTPMELRVARLVATGLSNKDVAAQCWVSPRTVGFHLRNVFTKLGITSRAQLAHIDLA